MGCLRVAIRSLRHALDVVFSSTETVRAAFSSRGGIVARFGRAKGADASYERITADVKVNVGLVCSVGVGRYEFLSCSDLGFIRTYDRGFILVPKR